MKVRCGIDLLIAQICPTTNQASGGGRVDTKI
jgi:hypothetical protein